MCYCNCNYETEYGSCAYLYPGPRPCEAEAARKDRDLAHAQTDTLCPCCLEAGRDHRWLYQDEDGGYYCPVCDVRYPAPEWVDLLGAALNRSLDECDAMRRESLSLEFELREARRLLAEALEAARDVPSMGAASYAGNGRGGSLHAEHRP